MEYMILFFLTVGFLVLIASIAMFFWVLFEKSKFYAKMKRKKGQKNIQRLIDEYDKSSMGY